MLEQTPQNNILYLENLIQQSNDKTRAALLDIVNMNKKEKVLSVHKYSIKQMGGKDNRWMTYIIADGSNKRKEIKKNSERELINYLYSFYGFDAVTFTELFQKWIPYKEAKTTSLSTIQRHEQHFSKYFLQRKSRLLKQPIHTIKSHELELECNCVVKECKLSKKEWVNVATILRGMFSYAVNQNMIKENPFEKVEITVKFRQVNRKAKKAEIFDKMEYPLMKTYMEQKFSETQDSVFLAILFQAFTGMRVGELITLKWSDIDIEERKIHITREETSEKYRGPDGAWKERRIVADHTKGYRDRLVDLLPSAMNLLKKTSKTSEWVFHRNGGRLTERQINYQLEKFAERQNIIVKRSHKLRKTYASNLHEAGISLKKIQDDLGHQSIRTTEHYIIACTDEQDYQTKAMAI